MKKAFFLLILTTSQVSIAQKIKVDCFIRSPQVYNILLTEKSHHYSPLLSTGISLYKRGAFADVGTFIGNGHAYGFYVFTGSSFYGKPIKRSWRFVANWFGEVTLLPAQSDMPSSWVYIAGISPVLLRPFPRSTWALALTLGAAYTPESLSLNTRLVLNYSIPIIN